MKLQPWLVTINYKQGAHNGLADALSRQEWPREGISACVGGHASSVSTEAEPLSGVGRCGGQSHHIQKDEGKDQRSREVRS